MRRFLRPILAGVVLLLLLALPITAVFARSHFLSPTWQPAQEQPIPFPHTIHVQTVGLECEYCHRTATTDAFAGIPALELCIACHGIIQPPGNENIQTLVNAFNNGDPVNWERVHQMPDHVHFMHAMHIQFGFDCAECHGDVGSMAVVEQVRDLRMADCVDCHRQWQASTDCATCHY